MYSNAIVWLPNTIAMLSAQAIQIQNLNTKKFFQVFITYSSIVTHMHPEKDKSKLIIL